MATVIILRGRIPAKTKDASPSSWKCAARSAFPQFSKEFKVIINALHQVAPFPRYASFDTDTEHLQEHRKAGRLQLHHGHRDRFASPDGNARNSITILQIHVLNVRVDIRNYDVISIKSAIFILLWPSPYAGGPQFLCLNTMSMHTDKGFTGAARQIDDVRRENGALHRRKNAN